jgi:hypothetical protein
MTPQALLNALMERDGLNPTSLAKKVKKPSLQSNIHKFLTNTGMQPRPATMQPVADAFSVDIRAFYDERVATQEAVRCGFEESGKGPVVQELRAPYAEKVVELKWQDSKLSVGQALLRVVAAFANQEPAVRAAAALLAADAIKAPGDAERLVRKIEALVDDAGDQAGRAVNG